MPYQQVTGLSPRISLSKKGAFGLMIGVRFIEGGKSKRAVIISKIRWRNAYPSGTTKFRTNR